MGRKSVENGLIKGLLLLNKKEENQGFRTDSTGRERIPLDGRKSYVYNTANDATAGAEAERSVVTKSCDVTDKLMSNNISAFAQDKIQRERMARAAEIKYLGVNTQKSYQNNNIYTPEQSRSIDSARQNPSGQIVVPKELLDTMKALIEANKSLKSEIDLIKEQRSENRIKKSFSAPRSIKRRQNDN